MDQPTTTEYNDAMYYDSSGKNLLDFRMVAMLHLNKIQQLQCKEWRGGYWDERTEVTTTSTITTREYIPDSRAEYINAVIGLYNLVHAHILNHNPNKKTKYEHKKTTDEAYNELSYMISTRVMSEQENKSPNAQQQEILQAHKLLRSIMNFMHEVNFFNKKPISDYALD